MARFEVYEEWSVQLGYHSYPIIIGSKLLNAGEILAQLVTSAQIMIVTNKLVAAFYLNDVLKALHGRQCAVVILDDGEEYKNKESLFTIYQALIDKNFTRDSTLIALGGGVISDISGFAASTYQRGIKLVHLPTTLLAQVDAAVGGKTAINMPQAKNIIGSFYQPEAVIIDVDTLTTLPEREVNAGFAEIIKYAVLQGGSFFNQVEQLLQAGIDIQSVEIASIINQCCQIKSAYVENDEKDLKIRALLNLGHTFGHALEICTGYKRWLHGEAVAIGLYAAALLSQLHCGLSPHSVARLDKLLYLANLPRRIPDDIDLKCLQELMMKDKKVTNNTNNFILIKEFGDCYVDDKVTETDITTVLQQAVKENKIGCIR